MSINTMAQEFTAMLKNNQHREAAQRYNDEGIVSIEAMDGPMAVTRGKADVEKKADWWAANHEMHDATAEGPFVNGDQFAVRFHVDVTMKETGQRMQFDEVGLYTVQNDRIVEERFFYALPTS